MESGFQRVGGGSAIETPVAFFQVFGEFEDGTAAAVDELIGGALVALEEFAAVGVAKVAGLDVEQEFDLPGLEGRAADTAADKLGQQFVELDEPDLKLGDGDGRGVGH